MTERTLSYRPGSWLGVIGLNATVLLPGTEKARAAALWPLVDEGAGFDAVLDALGPDRVRQVLGSAGMPIEEALRAPRS